MQDGLAPVTETFKAAIVAFFNVFFPGFGTIISIFFADPHPVPIANKAEDPDEINEIPDAKDKPADEEKKAPPVVQLDKKQKFSKGRAIQAGLA